MTDAEKRILLSVAREVIEAKLFNKGVNAYSVTPELEENRGAFVTLKKNHELQGCIGIIIGYKPLIDTVKETALSSAFNDPRFLPMTPLQWPGTKIEISVLSPLRPISNVDEIIVGTHGVLLRKTGRSAIFLPQVALEQGWDRDTMLARLCMKAGLMAMAWKETDTHFEVYTAEVFSEP
jgi:AmmeMemoRadiSam system protein A